jgi:invasion protein IalB
MSADTIRLGYSALAAFFFACVSSGLAFGDVADGAASSSVKSNPDNHQPAVATSSKQAAPQIYAQVYGDWVYRCTIQPQGNAATHQRCAVEQQMVLRQNGKAIPLITLAFTPAGSGAPSHVANVLAPLDVLLPSGIVLSVDASSGATLPYTFCDVSGCLSIGSPADGFIRAAQSGKVGHAALQLINGRKITINFSLNGLGHALSALDSGIPPATKVRPTA